MSLPPRPFASKISSCSKCSLANPSSRGTPGMGLGESPKLMLVGEAPGYYEDITGKPFVGQAGRLLQDILTQLIADAIISREDLYITNVVKHRPPNNRTPTALEAAVCSELFLLREIVLVQPKAIVALGGTASRFLKRYAVGDDRVRIGSYTYPLFTTWHPAYCLYRADKFNQLRNDILELLRLAAMRCMENSDADIKRKTCSHPA